MLTGVGRSRGEAGSRENVSLRCPAPDPPTLLGSALRGADEERKPGHLDPTAEGSPRSPGVSSREGGEEGRGLCREGLQDPGRVVHVLDVGVGADDVLNLVGVGVLEGEAARADQQPLPVLGAEPIHDRQHLPFQLHHLSKYWEKDRQQGKDGASQKAGPGRPAAGTTRAPRCKAVRRTQNAAERAQASRASPSSSPRRHGTAYGSFCHHRGGDQLVNARFISGLLRFYKSGHENSLSWGDSLCWGPRKGSWRETESGTYICWRVG